MALRIKDDSVHFVSVEFAMSVATQVVTEVAREMGVDAVISCGVEAHSYPSKHLRGALDFPTKVLGST